jgi:hypothetical protein
LTAKFAFIWFVNTKHRKTLAAIFTDPVNRNIEWRRIESLLETLNCQIIEGSGSRVTFIFNNQRLDIHPPHPAKEALRYRVKDVRTFLARAGIKP